MDYAKKWLENRTTLTEGNINFFVKSVDDLYNTEINILETKNRNLAHYISALERRIESAVTLLNEAIR